VNPLFIAIPLPSALLLYTISLHCSDVVHHYCLHHHCSPLDRKHCQLTHFQARWPLCRWNCTKQRSDAPSCTTPCYVIVNAFHRACQRIWHCFWWWLPLLESPCSPRFGFASSSWLEFIWFLLFFSLFTIVSNLSIYTNYVNVHLFIDKLDGKNYDTSALDIKLWL